MIIFYILLILFIPLLLCAIFNKHLPKWFCDNLSWHITPEYVNFDGCSSVGNCRRCNKKVIQDSQGNWF